jgi:hypothetical protein
MIVVPFKPEHLYRVPIQAAQIGAAKLINDNPRYGETLAVGGDAYTVLVDGEPVLCAGVLRLEDGRGWVWALFAQHSGKYFVRLCRYMQRYLQCCNIRRIEAAIDCNFKEGVRLAEMMGFQKEGVMRKYGANGEDYFMMGRI